ncbi:ROK family transcriptional regulator [Actinotalea fermentans]|uniref:Sugar kinase n=1 Tax=Actinotalea fermentans TaxID=43671 RepID=A0A511YZK1_9CELL|nr:ROK family protein [Actinotalea fermentans]GEN80644.1 sugar kinase [Actinotalea fermentans]
MPAEPELHAILGMVRSGSAVTRPELLRRSGLGRTLVNQRIAQLEASGLVEEGELAPSTGGRAPRRLRFRAEAGLVLGAELEARSMTVGITDLAGEPLEHRSLEWDVLAGPEETLRTLRHLADELLHSPPAAGRQLWAAGVGLPAPVEFRSGTPIAPPIMPGWDGFPVRDRVADNLGIPVWVDNEVNLLALGELRAGAARGTDDLVYVKLGTGIGAGLISQGRLHRGSQGCAGDVGHVRVVDDPGVACLCGKRGCLEAVAGGGALIRRAAADVEEGKGSPYLAKLMEGGRALRVADIVQAAEAGDLAAVDYVIGAGRHIGMGLAAVVNFFNPSLVIIGGPLAVAGDRLIAAIKEEVFHRSLALATRELTIGQSQLGAVGGMRGAAFMAIDELFRPAFLETWLAVGTPVGMRAP